LNDLRTGASIHAFFEAAENKNLFSNCPLRSHLNRLQEFDVQSADNILAHMLGHILDYRAGKLCDDVSLGQAVQAIDQEGLNEELRYIYNDCNNTALHEARVESGLDPSDKPEYRDFGPEQRGCFGADARAELMAEAIRAYMHDPNYLKSVAPNVAARIRAAVNTHPELSKIIQFN